MHHEYTVLDGSSEPSGLILRHERGDYHLAFPITAVPPYGTRLAGSVPAPGVQVLVCEATGTLYRLRFERIDCDPC